MVLRVEIVGQDPLGRLARHVARAAVEKARGHVVITLVVFRISNTAADIEAIRHMDRDIAKTSIFAIPGRQARGVEGRQRSDRHIAGGQG